MRPSEGGYVVAMDEHPELDAFTFMPPHDAAMHEQLVTRYRQPDWLAAPSNWLPGVAAMQHVAARSDDAIVQLAAIRAYPVGFSIDVVGALRNPVPEIDQAMFGHPGMMGGMLGADALPDGLLRIALVFADGSTVSSINSMGGGAMEFGADGLPQAPTMTVGGGGGGGGDYAWSYWCWPLPPVGDVRVICEWPAAGIARVVTSFDGALLHEAAAQAERLWDDPPDPPHAGGGVQVVIN